ncbi:MAG: hypothetical protein I3J02_09430 [Prevotella sp.]|nr:hypothetical protein [Prevotella sp.]
MMKDIEKQTKNKGAEGESAWQGGEMAQNGRYVNLLKTNILYYPYNSRSGVYYRIARRLVSKGIVITTRWHDKQAL